jgi:hypothetical protein
MTFELQKISSHQLSQTPFFDLARAKVNKIQNERARDFVLAQLSDLGLKLARNVNRDFNELKNKISSIEGECLRLADLSEADRACVLKFFQKLPGRLEAPEDAQADAPAYPKDLGLLEQIQKDIEEKKYEQAYRNLRVFRFNFSGHKKVIRTLYGCLHDLLPHLSPSQLSLETYNHDKSLIHVLLERTSPFPDLQRRLALDLGECHIRHPLGDDFVASMTQAMHFFARAIYISDVHSLPDSDEIQLIGIHKSASHIFMRIISYYMFDSQLIPNFTATLENNLTEPTKFEAIFNQIDFLKQFCWQEEGISTVQKLYQQTLHVLDTIKNTNTSFNSVVKRASEGMTISIVLNPQCATQTYWMELRNFRKDFEEEFQKISDRICDSERVRAFQKNRTEKFRVFLKEVILKDAFKLFFLEKSSYDFCGAGSFARDEICPFSDCEWKILIKNEEEKLRFISAAQFIECQLASLGESAISELPVFSTLGDKNKSGLHSDRGLDLASFVDTPLAMAKYQLVDTNTLAANSRENIFLSSKSIHQTDQQLHKEYEDEVKRLLPPTRRQHRALQRIKERIDFFKKNWPEAEAVETLKIIHLKDHYVEPLNLLISDLRLYFEIENTNTLEVIDILIENKVFSSESGTLVKEVVAAVYMIRVRLHLHHKEQVETIDLKPGGEGFQLKEVEWNALKSAYWLVLVPLYSILNKQVLVTGEFDLLNINLAQVLFERLLNSSQSEYQERNQQGMAAFVLCLAKSGAKIETHLSYYEQISKKPGLEHLRSSYINTLKFLPDQRAVIKRLVHCPNPYGLRQSTVEAQLDLDNKLRKVTSDKQEWGGLFSVEINGPVFNQKRYLRHDIIKALINSYDGSILQDYSHAAQNVGFTSEASLHFKQQPADLEQGSFYPGKEYAVSSLMQRLFGHGVSTSRLVKFDVTHQHLKIKSSSYLVLVSTTVQGTNFSVVKDEERKLLDKKRLSELFLSVPLLLPGDSREVNVILRATENEQNIPIRDLVFVDNDISWVRPVTKGRSPIIHLYYPLFLKFSNFILDKQAIQDFVSLKPGPILRNWFEDLINWNEHTHIHFRDFENLSKGFSPLCLFEIGMGTQLMTQFCRLQAFLKEHILRDIHADEVLKTIIQVENEDFLEIGPFIFNEYQKAKKLGKGLKEITGREERARLSMSKSAALMFQKLPRSEEQKKLLLPERALWETEQLIVLDFQNLFFVQGKQSARLEKGFKLEQGQSLDLSAQRATLKGLLLHSYDKLNLSHCSALTDKDLQKFLVKNAGILRSLDLRYCNQITDDSLAFIEKCPNLEELNLSYCNNITEFRVHKFLLVGKRPHLTLPKLTRLNISDCPKLTILRLKASLLETLDASNNPVLQEVDIETSYPFEAKFNNCPAPRTHKLIHTSPERPAFSSETSDLSIVSKGEKTDPFDLFKIALKDELLRICPDILEQIQASSNPVSEYIETLLPKKTKEALANFSQEHLHSQMSHCHESFCNYLINLSAIRKGEKSSAKDGGLVPLGSLFDKRKLFVADRFDYPAAERKLAEERVFLASSQLSHEGSDARTTYILSLIKNARQELNKAEGRNVISLIGNTGAGKSTTINYLLGCQMQRKEDQVIAEDPIAKGGHGLDSETCIPECFSLSHSDVVFCDMPGFLETRGPEVNIANAVNTRNLLIRAKSNRFFLLVNYHSPLADRGDGLKRSIRTLIKAFSSVQKLKESKASFLIGVTHIPANASPSNVSNIIKKIREIAAHVDKDLFQHEELIIPIDPLEEGETPNRVALLQKLETLDSLVGAEELYSTALSAEDVRLIQEIAEKAAINIAGYWKNWNIPGIIEEYENLSSLQCIEHDSIKKAVSEVRGHILVQVKEIVQNITSIVSDLSGEKRIKTQHLMNKLSDCRQLDVCFHPIQRQISDQADRVLKELEATESFMQESINSYIENDLTSLIQEFNLAIQEIFKNKRDLLSSFDVNQSDLLKSCSKHFKLDIFENLNFVLNQINCEIQLRPHKYRFPEVLTLKKIKEAKESTIHQLLITQHTQARIADLKEQFNTVYEQLYLAIESIISKHFAPLSQNLWDRNDLQSLAQFGFDSDKLQKIMAVLRDLEALVEDTSSYRERMETFLKKTHCDAGVLNKQKQIESINASINTYLAANLNQETLNDLNQLFHDLSNLDGLSFLSARQSASRVLVEDPLRELGQIILNKEYLARVKGMLQKIQSIANLPHCFEGFYIKDNLERGNTLVKAQEAKRRDLEIHTFSTGLPNLFVEAQSLMRNYAIKNFESVVKFKLVPTDIDQCLQLVGNISALTPYRKLLSELEEARKTQSERYYFQQDGQLIALAIRHRSALVTFFESLAGALNKQKQIESINASINTSLAANLNQEILNDLNQLFRDLSNLDGHSFLSAKQSASKVLVEDPLRELDQVILNKEYRAFVAGMLQKIQSIANLPHCFEVFYIKDNVERGNTLVKAQEAKRRNLEIHTFSTGLSTLFVEAQSLMRSYAIKNFESVVKLKLVPTDIDQCLQLVGNILALTPYRKLFSELEEARKTQLERYYFQQDDQLITLSMRHKSALVAFFESLDVLAAGLDLEYQINTLLKELEGVAADIIQNEPQKIVMHGCSSPGGFPAEKINLLNSYCVSFEQLVKQKGVSQEDNQRWVDTHVKIKNFKLEIDRAARIKAVESTTKQLNDVSLNRTYLNRIDEIQTMLEYLETASAESYQSACAALSTSLRAWQQDLEDTLAARKYTDIINAYVGLGKLKRRLEGHVVVETGELHGIIEEHINHLFIEAQAEIGLDTDGSTGTDKFFQLDKLQNFLTVLRTFENHAISLKKNKSSLVEAAKKQWARITSTLPKNISELSYPTRSKLLSKLAKEFVKEYAVAIELSIQEPCKAHMRHVLSWISSFDKGAFVYQLGKEELSKFKVYGSSIEAVARAMTDTFPEFEMVNRLEFLAKTEGITFALALERFSYDPPLDSSAFSEKDFKNDLNRAYKEFDTSYRLSFQSIVNGKFDSAHHVEQTKKSAKKLAPYATTLSSHLEETAHLLADIFAQWTYLSSAQGYHDGDVRTLLQPSNTQILSIFRLIAIDDPNGIKDHLAMIKTGEGKSISLGIIATLFSLLDYQVNVVCYSNYLSNRDQKVFSDLFDSFQLHTKIAYSTINGLVEKVIDRNLPNFRAIVGELLRGTPTSSNRSPPKSKTLLLLDEVDVFFGKNFYGQVHRPAVIIHTSDTEALLKYLWNNKESLKSLNKKTVIPQLMELACVQALLKEYPNLAPLLPNQLKSMLRALKRSPEVNANSYEIKDNKIGQIDSAGNITYSMHSYPITFAYLYYREKGDITADDSLLEHLSIVISCGSILFSEMPKYFDLKLGLTATLKELSEEENKILESYAFIKRSYIPSTYQKKFLNEGPTTVFDGEKREYFRILKSEIDSVITTNRATLIIFSETKDVNAFQGFLKGVQRSKSNYTIPECLTENIPENERAAIIARATAQYKTTLMTRLYGRGIDFICRDTALVANGGVHIIFATYPETLAEEIQFKGRTCRQDDPGSVRKILFAPDLLKQGLIPGRLEGGKTIPDLHEFNESEKQDWDLYLAGKRQQKCSKDFKDVYTTLAANTIFHNNTLQLAKEINDKRHPEALELLKGLNFF